VTRIHSISTSQIHAGECPFVQASGAARADVQRALLLDSDSGYRERLSHRLLAKGLAVETCVEVRDAARKLMQGSERFALVIVHVYNLARPWVQILQTLQEACEHSRRHLGPFFLCVTSVKGMPHLRLSLEYMGARVAYER